MIALLNPLDWPSSLDDMKLSSGVYFRSKENAKLLQRCTDKLQTVSHQHIVGYPVWNYPEVHKYRRGVRGISQVANLHIQHESIAVRHLVSW